jgi:CBS domain-containing protein
VFSSNPSTNFELTGLQSDTNLIVANNSIAAGTYTAVNVTVADPTGVFVNSSNATVGACVAGAFCGITGNTATITYTFPTALTLTENTNQYLNLDFNYNNAVVLSNNVVGIDVTQTGVMTASTTVPTGVPSGNFANIDDFTGAVTAVSSSSITVQSSVRGSTTAAISSATAVYDPQNQCTGTGSLLGCIQVGSIVSLQGLLSSTGVVTATSLDIIDISVTPADEVEGIIYPSNCNGGNNLGMILSDSTIFTSGSPLTSAGFGAGVCLTRSQTTAFAIDTGILTGQAGVPVNNTGFSGVGDLLAGQTVRAKVTSATLGTNGLVNATATELILRFSRLTGTVSTTAGSNIFTITNLPSYLGTTFSVPPQVITYTNATILEGQTSVSSLTGTVSMRALYLDVSGGAQYWFQAAKVRQH